MQAAGLHINDGTGGIQLRAKQPFFQPKLTFNQPNDIYEQEADAMADKVMRMTDPSAVKHSFFKPAIATIQRKCAHCEEEEKKLQRKENGSTDNASPETENYINTLSGGNQLAEKDRSFFESRMGYDFSNVKVHTDAAAVKSAQSVNALAYTTGSNIVFNEGQFNPDTDSGKRLLSHELTHVVQQDNGAQHIQRACDAAKTSTAKQAKIQVFVVANDDGTAPVAAPNMIAVDKVWEKCCIHMNSQPVKTIKKTDAKILPIGSGTPSAQESDLASNKDTDAINIMMVDSFKKDDGTVSKNHSGGGRTFNLSTGSPVSILVEGAVPTVVAHEIGHGLRGNTTHEAGTIMEGSGAYNAPNPDKVSSTVCSTVRNWGKLEDIGDSSTDCCLTY